MKFTSVVSYHTNPMTCGVAKFSAELARRLNVPFVGLSAVHRWGGFPLLSLKMAEVGEVWGHRPWVQTPFGVFWHDAGLKYVTDSAAVVFYADPSLGSPGLWCPSLITPRKRPVRLFSFGMAHKLQTDKYRRVRELLDAAGERYHLRVSVGLHEGTSLDGAEKHFDALRDIMGAENVTILGILSDEAVSEELESADCLIAFFEKGVRANNTTIHAAINACLPVVTNHDAESPLWIVRGTADISTMSTWPERYWLQAASACVAVDAHDRYSWDGLLKEMKGVCEKSESRIA
jgi:hypothetical protein